MPSGRDRSETYRSEEVEWSVTFFLLVHFMNFPAALFFFL